MNPDDRSRSGVRGTYDRIATHFSKTRAAPWPEVETFISEAPSGALGLDIGCGNGRHLEPLLGWVDRAVGLDASRGILAEADSRLVTDRDRVLLVQGDAGALPLADASVDLALHIATVHHLPTRGARVRSLAELERVLAADGTALVSAWNVTHDRFDTETAFDTTVDWTLPDGETVPRFYHIYDLAEFERDLEAAGLSVLDCRVSGGNCYGTVRP